MLDWLKSLFGKSTTKLTSTENDTTGNVNSSPMRNDAESKVRAALQLVRAANAPIDPSEFDPLSQKIAAAFANNNTDEVLSLLKQLLVNNRMTLFQQHEGLAEVARSLVECKDVAEIREWGADLLGRVGTAADARHVAMMAQFDDHPTVRKEALAAVGKLFKYRSDIIDSAALQVMMMALSPMSGEDDPTVLAVRPMVTQAYQEYKSRKAT